MRLLLQSTTRSTALSPSAVVSIAAHAAIIGGAMYGAGRDTSSATDPPQERIYYTYAPPPDRAPPSRESEGQLRYVQGGANAARLGASTAQPAGKGRGGSAETAAIAQVSGDRDARAISTPLASANDSVYSVLSVDDSAARDESSAAPVYPAEMLAKLLEGSVTARYVIDSTGHPEAASTEILYATNEAFAQSVRDVVPLMKFRAGSVAGRHVRQLVEQRFIFRIAPPAPAAADNTRAHPPA